ncbi:MAG: FAD-dependent oxidoreductase, partial [Sphingomonas sp.]
MTDAPPLDAGAGTAGTGAHRVLIVGGGVAGLDLAGMLGRRPALHVTLVDAATTHVWKPMLHSVAAGTQDMARAEVAYVAQARRHGFRYVPGRAIGVDPQARTVRLAEFALHGHPMLPERVIPYDTLVLATGSVAGTFGVPGVVEHARHIDTQEEAHAFQEMVVPRLFEATATGRPLNIAIVGGGATGVQLAAELLQMADIVDDHGAGSAREALRITLLDRGPRLLAAFPERISDAARARIEQLGVAVRLEADVASVDPDGVSLGDGEKVPAAFTIWAAGTEASPLAASLEALERGDGGRLVVDTRCRTTRFPDIFAIGDCAMMTPHGRDKPLPPTAQVAFQ